MILNYEDLKDKPVILKAMTSLNKDEFEHLCEYFKEVLRDLGPSKDPSKGGRKPILSSAEEKLFFILFYFKNYPLQAVIGYLFGMSQSQANDWIHVLTKRLQMTLDRMGYLPKRISDELFELLAQEGPQEVAIDGTERRINRPKDAAEQQADYSGKKKCHTVKNDLVAGINDRMVKYLSKTQAGRTHDKAIADEADLRYPEGTPMYQDKGFQGYAPKGVIIHQPKKKPKGGELTEAETEENRLISSIRVVVEHVISGIKRVRIVSDVFRNTKDKYDDLVMLIACGLHNLRTDYRLVSY